MGWIKKFFKELDNESEEYYHESVRMAETFTEAIKGGEIDNLMMVLKAFRDGEIGIFDEKKHSKISKQIEKL